MKGEVDSPIHPDEFTSLIGPVDAKGGTIATTWVSPDTVKLVQAVVSKKTAFTPVNPLPLMVTEDPEFPMPGLKELMSIAGGCPIVTVDDVVHPLASVTLSE